MDDRRLMYFKDPLVGQAMAGQGMCLLLLHPGLGAHPGRLCCGGGKARGPGRGLTSPE